MIVLDQEHKLKQPFKYSYLQSATYIYRSVCRKRLNPFSKILSLPFCCCCDVLPAIVAVFSVGIVPHRFSCEETKIEVENTVRPSLLPHLSSFPSLIPCNSQPTCIQRL